MTLSAAACSGDEVRPLVVRADGAIDMGLEANEVSSLADIDVCVSGDEPVDLITVTAASAAGDLKVTNFDVVIVPKASSSSQNRKLSSTGWTSLENHVSAECGSTPLQYLAIELRKEPGSDVARMQSFIVTYRSADKEYTQAIDARLALCNKLRFC